MAVIEKGRGSGKFMEDRARNRATNRVAKWISAMKGREPKRRSNMIFAHALRLNRGKRPRVFARSTPLPYFTPGEAKRPPSEKNANNLKELIWLLSLVARVLNRLANFTRRPAAPV